VGKSRRVLSRGPHLSPTTAVCIHVLGELVHRWSKEILLLGISRYMHLRHWTRSCFPRPLDNLLVRHHLLEDWKIDVCQFSTPRHPRSGPQAHRPRVLSRMFASNKVWPSARVEHCTSLSTSNTSFAAGRVYTASHLPDSKACVSSSSGARQSVKHANLAPAPAKSRTFSVQSLSVESNCPGHDSIFSIVIHSREITDRRVQSTLAVCVRLAAPV